MKKLILIQAILILHVICIGQTIFQPPSQQILIGKNELGVNLISSTFDSDYPGLIGTVLPGFYYKRHFGATALRLSVDYFRSDLNELSPKGYRMWTSHQFVHIKQVQLKIGFQVNFSRGRFIPFFYTDYFLSLNQRYTVYYGNRYDVFNYRYGGLAFGPGCKYQFNKYLAMSYEFALIFAVTKKDYGLLIFPVRQLGFSFMF